LEGRAVIEFDSVIAFLFGLIAFDSEFQGLNESMLKRPDSFNPLIRCHSSFCLTKAWKWDIVGARSFLNSM